MNDIAHVQTIGPQPGGWRNAIWNQPLSAWWAAIATLTEAALELVVQSAVLLFATTVVLWRTLAWRNDPAQPRVIAGRPLSEWWAATTFLTVAAFQLAAQTAAVLLATVIVVYRTLTWRGERISAGS
jgi:hypothetical protein